MAKGKKVNGDGENGLGPLVAGVARCVASRRDAYVLPEHILLHLCKEPRFAELCRSAGTDPEPIKVIVEGAIASLDKAKSPDEILPTPDYLATIVRISKLHEERKLAAFDPALAAFALFDCKDSAAAYALDVAGLDKAAVKRFLAKSTAPKTERAPYLALLAHIFDEPKAEAPAAEQKAPPAPPYTEDMVEKAKAGAYLPLIGREKELAALIRILHKKRACNPLLLGEAGVGKTAIAEGLAQRLAEGAVPPALKGARLWRLDLAGLLAGAKYRGDFEERFEKTLKALAADPKALVFIDEIHTICGAGNGADSGIDVASLLKPYLTGREIRCIGATTNADYRKTFRKDTALARRFKQIPVPEPSPAETLEILKGLRPAYEAFHGVELPEATLKAVVDLTERHLKDRRFPDKAIELLDELGAERASGQREGAEIAPADVSRLVAQLANIAPSGPAASENARLAALPAALKREVFGQDASIDAMVRHLRVAKAGLLAPNRPLGVWGLVGPTGTGKTELAKRLAAETGAKLIRLDMSEYSGKETVSKLIGTAPGYVGFEQAGLLTEPVIKNPNCVVLLDEIEKAHPAIHNLLLQTLDEGRLTDNTGREADFTNAVILLTSNVGAREAEAARGAIGFDGAEPDAAAAFEGALKKAFPPEFRNRLTGALRFAPLDAATLELVTEKAIRHLNVRLVDRECRLSPSPAVLSHIAEKAAKVKMGGRPVERLVNELIAEPLAELLLGAEPPKGEIRVELENGEIRLAFPEAEKKAKVEATERKEA